ncbi:MAG: hypothetical protein ACRC62_15470 [Microcoleus sp.]
MGEAKRRKMLDENFGVVRSTVQRIERLQERRKARLIEEKRICEQLLLLAVAELEEGLNSVLLENEQFLLFLNRNGKGYPDSFCRFFQGWFHENKDGFIFHPDGYIAITNLAGRWYNLTDC